MRRSSGLLLLCQNQAPQGNRGGDLYLMYTGFMNIISAQLQCHPRGAPPISLSTYLPACLVLPPQMAAVSLAWCFVPLQSLALGPASSS